MYKLFFCRPVIFNQERHKCNKVEKKKSQKVHKLLLKLQGIFYTLCEQSQ